MGGSSCSFTSHIETTGSVLAKSRNKKKNQQKLPTTIPISDQVSVGNPHCVIFRDAGQAWTRQELLELGPAAAVPVSEHELAADALDWQRAGARGEVVQRVGKRLAGADLPLGGASAGKDDYVWWQFYPSAEVGQGETIVFQVNIRETPTHSRKLVLRDATGESVDVTLPRFRPPEKILTAATYTVDYGKMFLQYVATGSVTAMIKAQRYC